MIILQRFDYRVPWCNFLQIAWIWTGELPGSEGLEFTQCSFFIYYFFKYFYLLSWGSNFMYIQFLYSLSLLIHLILVLCPPAFHFGQFLFLYPHIH